MQPMLAKGLPLLPPLFQLNACDDERSALTKLYISKQFYEKKWVSQNDK